MKLKKLLILMFILYGSMSASAQLHMRHSNVLVLTEGQGQHKPMSDAALKWLVDESNKLNFTMQVMSSPNLLDRPGSMDHFNLIIQLDYPPYAWSEGAARNFVDYIEQGKGAWIGFHHASLLGEFDGYGLWDWFSQFLGGIVYQNYIAEKADGVMTVEMPEHPVMQGVDTKFIIPDDEWYIYDHSPRGKVDVLASVDESTYSIDTKIKMGDHPVVWSNPNVKARNIYFQIGHSEKLYQTEDFTRMFHNAIKWGLKTPSKTPSAL